MIIDPDKHQVSLRIAYYGPALGGKTSNLQALKRLLPRGVVGRLMTLESRDRRTLLLDLLPIHARTDTDHRVRIRLVSVPGQAMHEATRKVLLDKIDGVVFVADSQLSQTGANNASFKGLSGVLSAQMPLVVQFNKRDLPDVRSDADLAAFAQQRGIPVHAAVAIDGTGVRETLVSILRLVWQRNAARHDLEARLGLDEAGFLARVLGDYP